MTPWYLYGFLCALLAWPAVALAAIHALLVHGKPEQFSQKRRRSNALWAGQARPLAGTEVVALGERRAFVRWRPARQNKNQPRAPPPRYTVTQPPSCSVPCAPSSRLGPAGD